MVHQATVLGYFSACASNMDVTSLKSLQAAIEQGGFGREVNRLTENIQKRLLELEPSEPERDPGESSHWREELLSVAQKLVLPQDIDWMEDDDDQRYVQHALDDIVALYKSFVVLYTSVLTRTAHLSISDVNLHRLLNCSYLSLIRSFTCVTFFNRSISSGLRSLSAWSCQTGFYKAHMSRRK